MADKKGRVYPGQQWKPDFEKGIKYINDIYISTVFPYLRRVEEIFCNR